MRFTQVTDGEWIEPKDGAHKIACCDCGLVHKIDFRVVGDRVQYRVFRDERATGQRRRWRKNQKPAG